MQLIVSGTQNGQPIAFRQMSEGAALTKARELQQRGSEVVHIIDITGRIYEPGEFAACFPSASLG